MNDIVLTPLELQHIEMVRDWRNSKEVSSYMYSDEHITSEGQEAWYSNIENDDTCKYWIIEFGNKPVGLASITGINRVLKSAYWAFYLGDSTTRGAGVGAKVEYNILCMVFDELKLNKLRCEVFVSNDKVVRMHEKFGFRREAYYREHCFKMGKYEDVVGLAILKSEWNQLRELMRSKIYAK
ncbi:MAG: UDP-4-amino-4,6-dideoxy-N-acetyl-beta-L-altrosamine N-acetyltransferase [Cyclobacteriaceae bacterium]